MMTVTVPKRALTAHMQGPTAVHCCPSPSAEPRAGAGGRGAAPRPSPAPPRPLRRRRERGERPLRRPRRSCVRLMRGFSISHRRACRIVYPPRPTAPFNRFVCGGKMPTYNDLSLADVDVNGCVGCIDAPAPREPHAGLLVQSVKPLQSYS